MGHLRSLGVGGNSKLENMSQLQPQITQQADHTQLGPPGAVWRSPNLTLLPVVQSPSSSRSYFCYMLINFIHLNNANTSLLNMYTCCTLCAYTLNLSVRCIYIYHLQHIHWYTHIKLNYKNAACVCRHKYFLITCISDFWIWLFSIQNWWARPFFLHSTEHLKIVYSCGREWVFICSICAAVATSEASLKCLSFSPVFTQSYTMIKLSELLSQSDRR